MKNLLKKIWNWEFSSEMIDKIPSRAVLLFMMVAAVLYVFSDVLLGGQDPFKQLNVKDSWKTMLDISFANGWKAALPAIWLRLAGLLIIFRLTAIIHYTFKSIRQMGINNVNLTFLTYAPSFLMSILITAFFYVFANLLLSLMGFHFIINDESLYFLFQQIVTWISEHTPHLFVVKNYWLALLLSIYIGALPGYFIHRLCHSSRFFWYVSHRAHHVPEFLHPMSMPNAFNFKLILNIIGTIVKIVVSSVIYSEPLVMEMTVWFTLSHFVEVYNHSSIYYRFALKNPIVRNVSRLFGEFGVYHIMHHSAKPEDHTINLSSGPFLIWDRLFGTYRKPYEQLPPLGLINQPNIYMNPIRIHLSGVMQLWYEWKNNTDFKTRFNIIFGDIWYMPPITKNLLVKESD